jgi:ubiquinone/menaquinone biosynthesis C-methylase UbiE
MSEKEKDHFSGHAACYQQFRPNYPAPLFAYLASLGPAHDLAWDCATGNGQAAVALAPFFSSVIATDFSAQQIDQAPRDAKVRYLVAPADKAPIEAGSVDLVTVAQALHWFDLGAFYAEVRRVAKPGGTLAVWCYEMHHITPEIDAIVRRLYSDIVGPYWPPERRIVEEGYRTLAFPFEELAPPPFEMVHSWDLEHVMGYFGSWSSTQRYRKQVGKDPLALIADDLKAAWGDPEQTREVVWPLNLRVGRICPVP